MSSFRDALYLWLKGHGLTDAECDLVCAHRSVEFSLKTEDYTGMVGDVVDGLYAVRNCPAAVTARQALRDTAEQMLLLQHLRSHSRHGTATPAPAPAKPAAAAASLSAKEALLQRICRELELTRSEYQLLHQALA